MANRETLDRIKELLANETAHSTPAADILHSELRSDSSLPMPVPGALEFDFIRVVWTYHIATRKLDEFHRFLKDREGNIRIDLAAQTLGATYGGTYTEWPQGNRHQTYWFYESMAAMSAFLAYLKDNETSPLYQLVQQLVSHLKDPALSRQRTILASTLDGYIGSASGNDPILKMMLM